MAQWLKPLPHKHENQNWTTYMCNTPTHVCPHTWKHVLCDCRHTCHSKRRGQRTTVRVSSLLPPCGIWEANSGHKAFLQALLPAEPFHWPLNIIIVVCIHVHAIAACGSQRTAGVSQCCPFTTGSRDWSQISGLVPQTLFHWAISPAEVDFGYQLNKI